MNYWRYCFYAFLVACCSIPNWGLAQANPQDTFSQATPPGDLELRIMMVDAMMELNHAMLEGVKASIDTLNLPENDNKNVVNEKDIQGTLLRMKRNRDRALLMPYLEHLKDSITQEIDLLQVEKVTLQGYLVAATTHPEPLVDTVAPQATKGKNKKIKPRDKEEIPPVQPKPEEPVVAAKTNKKNNKKTVTSPAMDTVIIYDIPPPSASKNKKPGGKPVIMDTASIGKALRDTTASIKIKMPNSNDSLVIKPIKTKNKPEIATKKPTVETVVIGADTGKQTKADPYMAKAKELVAKKDLKGAQAQLEKAVQQYAGYYDAWLLLADVDAQTGADTKALNEYKHCIKIDSSKWQPYFGMGKIYTKNNRKQDAIESYSNAINLSPQSIDPLMARAAVYSGMSEYKKAISDYDSVVGISKVFYKAYKERGNAKLALQKYNDAGDDFTRFLIFEPDDAESYYYRALSRIGTNEKADACLDFTTAMQLGFKLAENAFKTTCTDYQ